MADLIRILLVDDEAIFVENLMKVLSRRGMQVQAAGNGFEAMKAFDPEAFDVVILDLKMPGMDGLTTLEAIRRKDPSIPVILLTGYIDLDKVTQSLKLGATEVLLKPCPIDTLVSAIENARERRIFADEVGGIGGKG